MRTFVAVDVPSPPGDAPRSSAPEHLTLLFLGEIRPERVAPIVSALSPVGGVVRPFDLTLERVGAFPSAERPRVVWVGATEGTNELTDLARRVRDALSEVGEARGHEDFVPHLTLLRVRSGADLQRAVDLLTGVLPPPPPHRFRVHEFVLKESLLSPRGATHRTLATFPLEGARPDAV